MCKITRWPSYFVSANRETSDARTTNRGEKRVQSPEQNTFAVPMCKIRRPMRIQTTGDYAWRTDLYDDVGDLLGEPPRSGAVDASAEFTREMLPALRRAVEHEDMTEDLAEILSTGVAEVEYRIETGVNVSD